MANYVSFQHQFFANLFVSVYFSIFSEIQKYIATFSGALAS